MLRIRYSSRFKRDFKAVIKRGYDVRLLEEVLNLLVQEKTLPQQYLDHPLTGNYTGHRECHITPDWLLIYKVEKGILILSLTRTGTHSDLF
ncbi:type II toxin-antitoxin system YafQ family toxin [Desulfosporosinus sp. SYSU MS00001]|uniref:type II toxin-antitoxin system YafQ family toxin n=1 Tax=Desulfosporosinus sp. SYSU MS00001 TaxID=3416284 RepID=UPI003CEA7D9D